MVVGVIRTVALNNADAMAPQFSSPYLRHYSWSIFHHPSNNSPWDTHISSQEKSPQLQHEFHMD